LHYFVEKFFEELQKDLIELVHNSANKDDLKYFPIDVLWVVSSRNGTGNNGTNGKVGKSGTCLFNIEVGGLKFKRWACGEDFGFVLGVPEFGGGGLGWGLRVEGLGFEFGNIQHQCAIFTYFSICAIIICDIFTYMYHFYMCHFNPKSI